MQDENGECEDRAIARDAPAPPGVREERQVVEDRRKEEGASALAPIGSHAFLQRIATSRMARSMCYGVAIAALLTCGELIFLWFFNPFALLSRTPDHFSVLLTLSLHTPFLLFLLLAQIVAVSMLVFLLIEPLALLRYLRDLQKARIRFAQNAIVYHSSEGLLPTPVVYYQNSREKKNQAQNMTIHDITHKQDPPLLLLGAAGAGKTLALHLFMDSALRQTWAVLRHQEKIPVYLPLNLYNLYLKAHRSGGTPATEISEPNGSRAVATREQELQAKAEGHLPERSEEEAQAWLLRFLLSDNLPILRHLRPHLPRLIEHGQLLFLCDDLHVLDTHSRPVATKALIELLLVTQNHFIFTCRSGHEQEVQEFVKLEQAGHIERAVLHALAPAQVRLSVELQVSSGALATDYTAGQIMQELERTRLRYFCANPLMFAYFMRVLTQQKEALGRTPDTRGRLLQAYVSLAMQRAQAQAGWKGKAPAEDEVFRFLGNLACAARLAGESSALALSNQPGTGSEKKARARLSMQDFGEMLQALLAKHMPGEQLSSNSTRMLRFARDAALIEIDTLGILRLRFTHDVLASYFVAQRLHALSGEHSELADAALESIFEEMLADPARWSEPLALWAGLLDAPAALSKRLAALGEANCENLLPALALSLVCMGVAWEPPHAESIQRVALPKRIVQALTAITPHATQREHLAGLFRQCMTEGGLEIFRSLLFLLDVAGIEDFYRTLHAPSLLDILFSHMTEIVDMPEYDAEARRLRGMLAQFGDAAAKRAAELSQPATDRSTRLRTAAIAILGGTRSALAVDPLIRCLTASEPQLIVGAINALLMLGAELTLPSLLQMLKPSPGFRLTGSLRNASAKVHLLHLGALHTIERFLSAAGSSLSPIQHQQALEAIVELLASPYSAEPEIQRQGLAFLVKATRKDDSVHIETGSLGMDLEGEQRSPVPGLLAEALSSNDDVLVDHAMQALLEIDQLATASLVEQLNAPAPLASRVRILRILGQVRDHRALPAILRLVSDEAGPEQQQVQRTLLAYSPESIGGLIDLVLSDTHDGTAQQAARILETMGEQAADAVSHALTRIVPGRTQLLVQALQQLRSARAVPALIALLSKAHADAPLTVAIIRALVVFPQARVVAPLMTMLRHTQALVYEEAIDALSFLGEVALPELLAALDVQQEMEVTPRIRRTIAGMFPFPGEQLAMLLQESSDAQAHEILTILQTQGAEGAKALVNHLFDDDERARKYVYMALAGMPGPVVVPPLLEVLNQPAWFEVVAELLLIFPEAIAPLVNVLGEAERGEAAAAILPQYGPDVLHALVAGLDDTRAMASTRAQHIIVELVRDDPAFIGEVVHLFADPISQRARAALLDVVTGELAEESIPAFMRGLENERLLDDVAKAFVRLVRAHEWQETVLAGLLSSLRIEERQHGAEKALIRIGAPAVRPVGGLIADADEQVALAAQRILREIGVPALPFIWDAHHDTKRPAIRQAAMNVFYSMPTDVIRDELVALLGSDKAKHVIMALGLLLERIHRESRQGTDAQHMAPALLTAVQAHADEPVALRIIALLLLANGPPIVEYIKQAIFQQPDSTQKLMRTLLLLGKEAEGTFSMMLDEKMPSRVREEAAGMLSMLGDNPAIVEYARSLGAYGLAADGRTLHNSARLALSLRSLGGLLASGQWDIATLQSLSRANQYGSAERSLYNALLGRNYMQEIQQLQSLQQQELEAHNMEIINLTGHITSQLEQIATLEYELERVRTEHGLRGDELRQMRQERDAFRQSFEQKSDEWENLRQHHDGVLQERDTLRSRLTEALREQSALSNENDRLQSRIDTLRQDLARLQDSY